MRLSGFFCPRNRFIKFGNARRLEEFIRIISQKTFYDEARQYFGIPVSSEPDRDYYGDYDHPPHPPQQHQRPSERSFDGRRDGAYDGDSSVYRRSDVAVIGDSKVFDREERSGIEAEHDEATP